MKKKDVMLVAGYPYLTESTFQALESILGDRIYIYDPFDYNLSRTFKNYQYPSSIQDKIINCSRNPIWKDFTTLPWSISIFLDAKRWSSSIIKDVNKLNPKTIIFITDIFPSSRIIEKYFFKNKNLILIQPCLIDAWEREDNNKRKRAFLNLIFREDFFHTQQYWGLESSKSKLCLYDQELHKFFKDKRDNISFIESPMKKYYANTILKNRTFLEEGKKLKVGIFPVDYSSTHGLEYQKYLEKKYFELCEALMDENLIIKIHPHEDIKYWKSRLPDGLEIIKDLEKNLLYSNLDIHISTYSYSSIEAFFSGNYAINFEPIKILKQGHLEEIFMNNSSLYAEEIIDIKKNIHQYKMKSRDEKKLFIENNLKIENENKLMTIEDLL